MTHKLIRSKFLRSLYAQELNGARRIRKSMGAAEWGALSFGIETGFWAVQKAMMRDAL